MGQLVIKKASWLESHAKQLVIWGPIAAVQASTLVGLGYFYQRLNALETNETPPQSPSVLAVSTLQDVKPPTLVRTSRIPLPPPPGAPAAVGIPVAMNSPAVINFMRVGQDFSAVTATKPVAVTKSVTQKAAPIAKPVVKPVAVVKPSDDELVAQANRAEIVSKPEVSKIGFEVAPSVQADVAVADTSVIDPVVIPEEIPRGKPLPVGIVVWVYLGELREQGWHGQRLHIASDSGLPTVGQQYRTQKIHGIYDQPYGSRTMGGFQKGDMVKILDVRHEANLGVWAQVRKVSAVGKPGCVTCTQ